MSVCLMMWAIHIQIANAITSMTDVLEKLMSITPATVPAAKYGAVGLKAMAAERLHCFK